MSHQVLARKWRPQSFTELAGQQHVLQALSNALEQQRIHHAYLLTGTRGVGKTTIARILARCLNCEQGISATPCGECSSCREISEGRSVDLIEVDAASRTKVEDTRDLLDNVQYAPSVARYKIYLIDEVHMLSNSSFNALLKTLEEPPPHAVFVLATTHPQKIPATVLSRCLQFHLKNLPAQLIVDHVAQILESEGIKAEQAALQLIAHAASGSMRDALSLVEQAISFGDGQVLVGQVNEMLGVVDHQLLVELTRAIIAGDGAAALALVASYAERATDFLQIVDAMLSLYHRVAVEQLVPGAGAEAQLLGDAIVDFAARVAPEDIQLYYQILLNAKRDMALAPDPLTGIEMLVLRLLAFRPAGINELAALAIGSTQDNAQGNAQGKASKSAAIDASAPLEATSTKKSRAVSDRAVSRSAVGGESRDGRDSPGSSDAAQNSRAAQHPASAVQKQAGVAQKDGVRPNAVALDEQGRVQTPAVKPVGNSAEQADSAMAEQVLDPAQLDPPTWCDIFARLPLSGVVRAIGGHCVPLTVVTQPALEIVFGLRNTDALLYKPEHDERLARSLAIYFGCPVGVKITLVDDWPEVDIAVDIETPVLHKERLTQERQQLAMRSVEENPNIQALLSAFDAELDLDSVVAEVEPDAEKVATPQADAQ